MLLTPSPLSWADALAEVEITGAHTQFFDKFNIRYEIFQVIKCIWSNQIYRMRLSQEAKYALAPSLLPPAFSDADTL